MQTCIKFEGTDISEGKRRLYFTTFSSLGEVTRIFIDKSLHHGYIYFKDPKVYNDALKMLQDNEVFNFQYSLQLHDNKGNQNTSRNSVSGESDNTGNLEEMGGVCASEDNFLYCLHGHKIPQFTDDNDFNYVPVHKLKCLNVKLFDFPPNESEKLNSNEQLEHEFEIYMKQVAIKFMHRNKIVFDMDYVKNIIAECKGVAFQKYSSNNNKTQINKFKYNKPASNHLKNDTIHNSSLSPTASTPVTPRHVDKSPVFDNRNKGHLPVNTNGNYALRTPNYKKLRQPSDNYAKTYSTKDQFNNTPPEKKITPHKNFSSKNDLQDQTAILTYVEPTLSSTVKITITYVDKGCFYAYLTEREEIVENLLFDTNTTACNAKPTTAKIGSMVFATFLCAWYRAIVLETSPKIIVKYVDYGNVSTDEITEVREMNKEFQMKPAEALKLAFETKANIILTDEMVITVQFLKKLDAGSYVVKYIPDKPAIELPLLEKVATGRKCVIEIPSRNSLMNVVKIVNDRSLVALIFNDKCIDEISLLDTMGDCCSVDPNYRPTITDLIAVKDKDTWKRGIVMTVNKTPQSYKCALIDYGTIIETNTICKLDPQFQNLLVCVCVINVEPQHMYHFKEGKGDVNCEVLKDKKIIIHVDDTSIPATGSNWDPHQLPQASMPERLEIKNGDIVKLIDINDDLLYLRSKESYSILTRLNEILRSHITVPLSSRPIESQLILHKHGNQWRRAIVKSTSNMNVDLYYLDYGSTGVANLKDLCKCDKEIADFPITVLEYPLNNFGSDKAAIKKELRSLEKQKFNVIINNGVINFQFENSAKTLSDHLKKPIGGAKVVMFDDLPKHKIKMGNYKLLCLCANDLDKGIVAFSAPQLPTELFVELSDNIKAFTETPHGPYHPTLDEICLALYDDTWYRAVVKNIVDDNYEVYYLDYGNFMTVKPAELRSVNDTLVSIPPVAILCEIEGFRSKCNDKYIKDIRDVCKEEAVVEMTVLKEIEWNKYLITLPMENDDDLEDF